jgi:hypothetical protein
MFSSTFKTSTPEDLLITVNSECGIYTAVGATGKNAAGGTIQTSSTAIGDVVVWVELDGKAVPTNFNAGQAFTRGSATTAPNGPVTFCNRAFNLSTQGLPIGQWLAIWENTKQANSFAWYALNVGNGPHTLNVYAELTATATGDTTGSTFTFTTPAASAMIGQRTLSVEPVNLMNSTGL